MRIIAVGLIFCAGATLRAVEPAAAHVEFFESKVRPLLIDHCLACHGEKKQEAGLRLDRRDGFLKGSDAGPIVVGGNPDASKLIKVVHYAGEIRMPPKGKLSDELIATLTDWVKLGAPYPASSITKPIADPRKHWAFQPVQKPAVPDAGAYRQPVDRFILPQLKAHGLGYSPIADKRTLIRRAYFDLINLPPTADEIEAFEKDTSADAYEKLVDRLLASPHYGEAQARRWLDFARYADTKGYVFQEDRNYPYAYTYRDWAIRAFNEDMPYDRFIQLQIAADRLKPEDPRDLAAMGFLTLGRRFLNNVHDIIDDRLDVTCRTFMGLTVACARCHDHKYDPIPAADYYSLYGVFASSTEPKVLPLIGEVDRTPEVIAFENELQKKEDGVSALKQKLHSAQLDKLRKPDNIAAYLLAVRDLQGTPNERTNGYLRERDLNSVALQRWRDYLRDANKNHSPVFAPLKALQSIPDAEFAKKAPETIAKVLTANDPKKSLNPLVVKALEGLKPASFKEVTAIYGKLIAGHWPPPAGPVSYPQSELTSILGAGGPADVPIADAEKIFNRDDRNKLNDLKKKLDAFKAASPFAPPRAMVLADGPGYSPYVFLRGNPGNRGPAVKKQFLEILSAGIRKPFTDGSGRLELAKSIADPKNPLTARVMVNRIWAIHFGQGLVRTPSDFGVRSDPPTHPALLDWLASEFVESGWSVKKMHRLIMLSSAYQQQSIVSDAMVKLDAENRLLGRQNRKRLDFEGLRDGMLLTAGSLDRTLGGKPVDIFKEPFSRRRTVYGFIDRQNLPGTFRIFDFASPDTHSPQRFVTTVPQQALFLMNSPFVLEQSRKLVARPEIASKMGLEEKVKALFRSAYGRMPSDEELSLSRTFLEQSSEKTRWELFAQALLLGNDFAFVD